MEVALGRAAHSGGWVWPFLPPRGGASVLSPAPSLSSPAPGFLLLHLLPPPAPPPRAVPLQTPCRKRSAGKCFCRSRKEVRSEYTAAAMKTSARGGSQSALSASWDHGGGALLLGPRGRLVDAGVIPGTSGRSWEPTVTDCWWVPCGPVGGPWGQREREAERPCLLPSSPPTSPCSCLNPRRRWETRGPGFYFPSSRSRGAGERKPGCGSGRRQEVARTPSKTSSPLILGKVIARGASGPGTAPAPFRAPLRRAAFQQARSRLRGVPRAAGPFPRHTWRSPGCFHVTLKLGVHSRAPNAASSPRDWLLPFRVPRPRLLFGTPPVCQARRSHPGEPWPIPTVSPALGARCVV